MKKGTVLLSKIIKDDRTIYTFIRSGLSSAVTAIVDLSSRIILYSFVFISLSETFRSNLSVSLGTIIGAIVNFTINKNFTFHSRDQKKRSLIIKFIFVWLGGLVLNMYGTILLSSILNELLTDFKFSEDFIFSLSTFLTACIVSVFWNFLMQRYFVFRSVYIDKYL